MIGLMDPKPGGRPGDVKRASELAYQLGERGVRGVVLSWVDTAGINRVKTIAVDRLVSAAKWGVGMSPVFDTYLADDSIVRTNVLGGPDGDLRLFPDLGRLVVLASQPGWAWVPVDRITQDGEVHAACTRSLLRRVVSEAEAAGYTFKASIEIEFALGLGDVPPTHFAPACVGPAYSMIRLIEQTDFCAAALAALAAEGIDVDQIHPEYGTGQYEVSVGALDPVAAADRSVLTRQTLRAVAHQHSLRISFAPSVTAEGVGNGGHVHLSMWQGERNLHATGDGPLGMTPQAQSLVAGIIETLPSLAAILTPSPSSFLRLRPSHWAGVYACWGHETREAAVRVVQGTVGHRERAANVEIKCTDLAANPYLALAGVLAAGLDGVRRGLLLGSAISDDPSRFSEAELTRRGVGRLPTSLGAAIAEFRRSALLRTVLGDVLADAVVAVREGEQQRVVGLTDAQVAEEYRWVY